MSSEFPRANITKPARVIPQPCSRCDGSGVVWPYGTCFRCGGGRTDPQRAWGFPRDWSDEQCAEFDRKRKERNRKARDARQAKHFAEWQAKQPSAEQVAAQEEAARLEREAIWNANVAELPELAEIAEHPQREQLFADFLLDICDQAQYRMLSDRQREVFARVAAKQLKRAAR